MELQNLQRIYFLGIGGIGMSALARYFLGRGCVVAGYDRTETELTRALSAEGMQIHYTDDVAQILPDADLIIYTPAIPKDHKEWNLLRAGAIPFKKRSEVLGIISRGMQCLAVAGTHGKTTTTTILTHILRTGGVDCTAFLGGISNDLGSNFVQGKSNWAVVEADEFDRSFLQLNPDITVINSLDPDHLDIYGSVEEMRSNYFAFAQQIKTGGHFFYQDGLSQYFDEMPIDGSKARFGINTNKKEFKEGYFAHNIAVKDGFFTFDVASPIENITDIRFTLPGRHNVQNATAAIAAAQQLGVTGAAVKAALGSFKGIHRRFEFVVRDEKTVFIDDYAHHPEELRAAIDAARELYPNRRITGIFQPHLFSRTRDFQDGFAEVLDGLDQCILLPIYPARELPMEGIVSEIILAKMQQKNALLLQKSDVLDYVKYNDFEVLMTLGAGDIDKMVGEIEKILNSKL